MGECLTFTLQVMSIVMRKMQVWTAGECLIYFDGPEVELSMWGLLVTGYMYGTLASVLKHKLSYLFVVSPCGTKHTEDHQLSLGRCCLRTFFVVLICICFLTMLNFSYVALGTGEFPLAIREIVYVLSFRCVAYFQSLVTTPIVHNIPFFPIGLGKWRR